MLLKGRKNTQVTLHTAIVVIADVIGDLFCNCLVFCGSGAFLAGEPAIIRCSGYSQYRTSFFDCVAAFFAMLLDSFIEMDLPYLR